MDGSIDFCIVLLDFILNFCSDRSDSAGMMDVRGASVDVSNVVAMLDLFAKLKKFTPVLFVGTCCASYVHINFVLILKNMGCCSILKHRFSNRCFRDFTSMLLLSIITCIPLIFTPRTFSHGENDSFLESFFVVLNPGPRTELTVDAAIAKFEGMSLFLISCY
jgi:hypothetical protein